MQLRYSYVHVHSHKFYERIMAFSKYDLIPIQNNSF